MAAPIDLKSAWGHCCLSSSTKNVCRLSAGPAAVVIAAIVSATSVIRVRFISFLVVLLGCLLRNFRAPRLDDPVERSARPALSLPSTPWRQGPHLPLQLGLELAEDAQVDRAKKIVEGSGPRRPEARPKG